jgi:hypothetical protein
LKRRDFRFVGSTICYAFMQAIGMVNDHTVDCFRYAEPASKTWTELFRKRPVNHVLAGHVTLDPELGEGARHGQSTARSGEGKILAAGDGPVSGQRIKHP